MVLNKNPNRPQPLPLEELSRINLKRVVFRLDELKEDPQQQIPSRNPHKGNVVIPSDLLAPPSRLNLGIVPASGAAADTGTQTKQLKELDEEYQMAVHRHQMALRELQRHAQEAHAVAVKLADDVRRGSKLRKGLVSVGSAGDDAEVQELVSRVGILGTAKGGIDGPMHMHENQFGEEPAETEESSDEDEGPHEIPLELVYTRCCHLREILPIPTTLKQLKGKKRPLQVLKLLNPRPTLIDVLLFLDFIAITPIHTLILDNVTVTNEMLYVLLLLLRMTAQLEKLSLRNVAMGPDGWRLLCKFLSRNRLLTRLDISQQRVKPDTPQEMYRASMDWNLFINALLFRGGLEELVINGCRLLDEQFALLLRHGVGLSTRRLGVAQTGLTVGQATALCEWVTSPGSHCFGVDVAYNDLTQGQLEPFIAGISKAPQLMFFLLNLTNVSSVDDMDRLLAALGQVPTLRFLDLSLLPQLFPGILKVLEKRLPQFPDLRRIHFDLNNLDETSIRVLSAVLPRCTRLVHVLFLGNPHLLEECVEELYHAVKMSPSLYTLDLDKQVVSEEWGRRMAVQLMRNMETSIEKGPPATVNDDEEELMFDGLLLTRTAEKLLGSMGGPLACQETQGIINTLMVERARTLRQLIHQRIDTLFAQRTAGTLLLQGKENLIRLCILDDSLGKITSILERSCALTKTVPPVGPALIHARSHDTITTGPIVLPVVLQAVASMLLYFSPKQPPVPSAAESAAESVPHEVVTDASGAVEDRTSGKPVLFRRALHQSVEAQRMEEEEGEVHKIRFNMHGQDEDRLEHVPTGSELREAIIRAVGKNPAEDFVAKMQQQGMGMTQLLREVRAMEGGELSEDGGDEHAEETPRASMDEHAMDSTYDRLLEAVQRVRASSTGLAT